MAGSYKGLSDQQIQKRIKEGRGQGEGRNYKPWIQTWDVSSLGRSHRIFGNRSCRLHHLLSDLELAIFLTLDWQHSVLDIREQFPLRVEDTTRLADELGISHAVFKGTPQVLSSDFLVTFDRQTQPLMAFQAKYSADLSKPEVIERLQLEKRYWEDKRIPWAIITEKEISKEVVMNIQWLYPAESEKVAEDELHHQFLLFQTQFNKQPNDSIIKIAQQLDLAYNQESGQALFWLRHLLARRYFQFDINLPYRKLIAADLIATTFEKEITEANYVSG